MNELIAEILKSGILIHGVLSRNLKKDQSPKITLRPVQVKGRLLYQFTLLENNKALHINFEPEKALQELQKLLNDYSEAHFFTPKNDYHCTKKKGSEWKISIKAPLKTLPDISHNREKKHLLKSKEHTPFWQALGIAGVNGQILANKYSKYRQVNRFLEIIDTVLPYLSKEKTLKIVDFGCGKAYLTFALSHYLENIAKCSFEILGIDLKEDVVLELEDIRKRLKSQFIRFVCGDIRDIPLPDKIDLVISLHACDTATDAIIERAIGAQAEVILTVPCCHHAYFKPIQNNSLIPILKHGILRERFSAIALDAARALYLELNSYKTDIIEFIETEHTPKNLLLKAIKVKRKNQDIKGIEEELNHFLELLHLPHPKSLNLSQ